MDILKIGNKTFSSRLILGTGKYQSLELAKKSIEASKTEIVTVAVRRLQNTTEKSQEKGLIDFECGLCEEEISSTDVATCIRCEKQWCIECAVKWYQKSDLKTCPYCRNEDVNYPFDVSEVEEEVIEEFAAFPAGEHDDLVDSSSQALIRFRQGGFIPLHSDEEDEDLPPREANYY